jgi:hypothetical protein
MRTVLSMVLLVLFAVAVARADAPRNPGSNFTALIRTLCQVGVELSDSAVTQINCGGPFTASIAATDQA